jgi:hypothetical protein
MSETRKLAAILVADVIGYSRLAGRRGEKLSPGSGRCAIPTMELQTLAITDLVRSGSPSDEPSHNAKQRPRSTYCGRSHTAALVQTSINAAQQFGRQSWHPFKAKGAALSSLGTHGQALSNLGDGLDLHQQIRARQ